MQDDAAFSLTATERERLRSSQFDPDAIEQLLQRVPAAARASTLRSFIGLSDDVDATDIGREAAAPDLSVLESISDPEMQELLERAWAPRWQRYSLEKLERIQTNLPGLATAIREARRQRGIE